MRVLFALMGPAALLAGCAHVPAVETTHLPQLPRATPIHRSLAELPRPTEAVTLAVYGFADQTGQFRPDGGQALSRAVSQGGASILMKALSDTGAGQWFTVLERESLRNLLTERQLIAEMRQRYAGEETIDPKVLPSLLYAGVLLEGGIISYDSDTLTGGAGASLLGIGGDVKYRQDSVGVYLRAVSVKTGQVLASVQTSKTIASSSLQGSAFRFVALKELLQAEAGYTTNEPGQVALQQAIEKAVYALVMEGAEKKLWRFADTAAAEPARARYRQERDGIISAGEAVAAENRDRRAAARAAGKTPRG